MNLSSRLIARLCEYSLRPLENWEQGRAKPNAQAALLISSSVIRTRCSGSPPS